ncbi:ABC transporter ATP-binding protein [Caloranaerobacter sp. DY30410]|uniref:ABC transporter ATP-binding protein n=1 Tax=Caloranaerobacter sp. DY30410 TaxID=3238305 RepID=UPI003D019708
MTENRKSMGLELTAIIVLLTITAFLNTLYPVLIKELIDESISLNIKSISQNIVFLLVVTVALLLSEFFRRLIEANYRKNIVKNLRNSVLAGILRMNYKDYSKTSTGEYMSMINNDIELVTNDYYIMKLRLFQSIISIFFSFVAMIKLDVYLAFIVIVSSFIPLITPYFYRKILKVKKNQVSLELKRFSENVKDILEGFELIKSYNIQSRIKNLFITKNNNSVNAVYEYSKTEIFSDMLAGLFSFVGYITLIIFGIILIINGKSSVGTLLAAIQISELLVNPIMSISGQINRINSIRDVKKSIESFTKIKNTEENNKQNNIDVDDFKNLTVFIKSFYYDNNLILKDINLKLERGKKYAIVGLSGSGKSTLLKLINGSLHEFDGFIKLNNFNINSINQANYHNIVTMIHQDTFIFNDTLENNITLYQEYDKSEIDNVIKQVKLEHLKLRNDGFNLDLRNGGNIISGGEKQRISIARALLKNSKVLLLDEATASLDNITYQMIENILVSLDDVMVISVTHKLYESILKRYDEIIVMHKGSIYERGSFDELMKRKTLFYSLYNTVR